MPNYTNGLRGSGKSPDHSWAELSETSAGGVVTITYNGNALSCPRFTRVTTIGPAISPMKVSGIGTDIYNVFLQVHYSGLYLIEFNAVAAGGQPSRNAIFVFPMGSYNPATFTFNFIEKTSTPLGISIQRDERYGALGTSQVGAVAANEATAPVCICVPLYKGDYIVGTVSNNLSASGVTITGRNYLRATALKIWE